MNTKFTYPQIVIAIFLVGLLMFLMRASAFIVFAKKEPPKFLRFVEKYIPSLSIAVLFLVCLKEKTLDLVIGGGESPAKMLSALGGAILTVMLQLWKKNSMISIFSGTILFMLLSHIL